MRIAVNNIHFGSGGNRDDAVFVQQLLQQLVMENPTDEFIFFDNKDIAAAPNATTVIVANPPKNWLAVKFWNNVQLPLQIKKNKVGVLVQPNGQCSLTTKVKQVLVLTALLANKKNNLGFLKKAATVIVPSAFAKEILISKYQLRAEKIKVLRGTAPPIFQPLGPVAKTICKDVFAGGAEYFLLAGNPLDLAALLYVLKAFSMFKKWQKSSMKLLVLGNGETAKKEVSEKLSMYKYRHDVVVLHNLTEAKKAEVTASAYAALYHSTMDGFSLPIIQALQSGTAMIASSTAYNIEVGGDTVLYAANDAVEKLANQMKLLYRDENLRSVLITKATEKAKEYRLTPELLIG